ncbi:unnamed protein product [Pleuronectes platessa]|uniref:Uncharacterized protein n=1 Tax=Pleuronectes platessa TaxID=8262 RepID=A0A9N7VBV4_PLEPL|nr:unnamed protein product [Pleuronectes platessa]
MPEISTSDSHECLCQSDMIKPGLLSSSPPLLLSSSPPPLLTSHPLHSSPPLLLSSSPPLLLSSSPPHLLTSHPLLSSWQERGAKTWAVVSRGTLRVGGGGLISSWLLRDVGGGSLRVSLWLKRLDHTQRPLVDTQWQEEGQRCYDGGRWAKLFRDRQVCPGYDYWLCC